MQVYQVYGYVDTDNIMTMLQTAELVRHLDLQGLELNHGSLIVTNKEQNYQMPDGTLRNFTFEAYTIANDFSDFRDKFASEWRLTPHATLTISGASSGLRKIRQLTPKEV